MNEARSVGGPPYLAPDRLQAVQPSARHRFGERGFTLIELGLVLLIIGIVLGLVVPRFQDRSRAELLSNVRRLAVTIHYLRDQAILDGRIYRLNYDLDQQRYWVTSVDEETGTDDYLPEEGTLGRGITLPSPVGISDVVLPLVAGKLYEGIAYTHFYPDGYVDLTVVHMDNGQDAYTLRIDSLTGRVYLTAGYQDFDFST
jgi:general secretion pathway protein H